MDSKDIFVASSHFNGTFLAVHNLEKGCMRYNSTTFYQCNSRLL